MKRFAILAATSALVLGGCTTMRGAPMNVLEESESKLLVVDLDDSSQTMDLITREQIVAYSVRTSEKKAFRNRVIDHYMGEIDRHYEKYSQRLFSEGIELGMGFDAAIIGLSSTAALFESSADDLATAIAGFAGVQSAINKNLYFDRTLPALIVTMDAQRTKVETDILRRKQQEFTEYSVEAAIRDLRRYQQAGTMMRAVTKVTETASNDKEQAEREYEAQLGYSCNVDDESVLDGTDQIGRYLLPLRSAAQSNPTAEIKLRSVASVLDLDPQGTVAEVHGRILDALDQGYCSADEVDALISRIEAVTKDDL